tara:strand:- start:378 stop:509 length:132 start_codon:yes stop_codon:yes gene_type:complete
LRLHSFTTREKIFYEEKDARGKEDKNEQRDSTIRVDDEEHKNE